jgi:ferritin-like metal-binding protein YciE
MPPARLEKIFKALGQTPKGKTCDAILGLIEEGKEIMEEYEATPAVDAGLLAAAQAVEHYEISRYGTLRTWAAELGERQAFGCWYMEQAAPGVVRVVRVLSEDG